MLVTIVSQFPFQASTAQATIPKYINFQGKLTKVSDGTNMTNGTYAFEFKIYDALSAGSLLWTETFDQASGACGKLTVTNGVFNAKLGSCNALTIDMTGGSLFISVNFAPTGTSYDGEMSPRKQLVAAPFAFVANSVSGDGVINTVVSSATALTVAKAGSNYGLQVDTSAGSAATGLKITSAAAAGGIALAAISSGTNENLTLDAKGSGTVSLGASSTGSILFAGGSGSSGVTITAAGALTADALITGSLGLTITGAAVSLNASSNFDVNIATGTSTGDITLGGGTAGQLISINSDDWDISTAGAITGVSIDANGSGNSITNIDGADLTADTLDFTEFQDTLDLDAALVLNQGTNTWTQNFTGDTTTGLSYVANSLTTGKGISIASSSLTTGKGLDIQISGTAADASQTALNILTAGATATNGITTYGAQISNTHTNATGGTNIALYLNASGATTANYGLIVNAGNVGIGTTAPGFKLDVVGATTGQARFQSTGSNRAGIYIDNATTGQQAVVDFLDAGSEKWLLGKQTDNSFLLYDVANSKTQVGISTAGLLQLGGAQQLSLPAAGNVGIGTTSPGTKLTVSANTAALPAPTLTSLLHLGNSDTTRTSISLDSFASDNALAFRRSNGTTASPSALLSDETIGQLVWYGYGATSYNGSSSAKIVGSAAENWTDATMASYLSFYTRPSGTAGASSERLRIDKNGNVGIGTTSPGAILDVKTASAHHLMVRNSTNGINVLSHDNSETGGVYKSIDMEGSFFTWNPGGAEKVRIDTNGNVGIGTTTPGNKLTVIDTGATQVGAGLFGLHQDSITNGTGMAWISTDDASNATDYFMLLRTEEDSSPDNEFLFKTDGNATSDGAFTGGGADVAEWYPKTGNTEAGDVLVIDSTTPTTVTQSPAGGYHPNVIGVVSTNPGLIAGGLSAEANHDNDTLVALAGRVPVKVTTENGPIKAGEYLTSSAKFPGFAMKATGPGKVIGQALEDFDGITKTGTPVPLNTTPATYSTTEAPLPPEADPAIKSGKMLLFVNVHYWVPSVAELLQDNESQIQPINGHATLSQSFMDDMSSLNLMDASVFGKLVVTDTLYIQKDLHVKGITYLAELRVDKIQAKEITTQKLCVDDICVTRDQFKAMFDKTFGEQTQDTVNSTTTPSNQVNGADTTNETGGTTPPPDTTPTPEPIPPSSDTGTVAGDSTSATTLPQSSATESAP